MIAFADHGTHICDSTGCFGECGGTGHTIVIVVQPMSSNCSPLLDDFRRAVAKGRVCRFPEEARGRLGPLPPPALPVLLASRWREYSHRLRER